MNISQQTQAMLLLTAYLGKADKHTLKPLSIKEWNRLAVWLHKHDFQPEMLLEKDWPILLKAGKIQQ